MQLIVIILEEIFMPGSCKGRGSSSRVRGTLGRSSSRCASSRRLPVGRDRGGIGQAPELSILDFKKSWEGAKGVYLERELELLVELGHELVMRECLPRLHDTHYRSVDLELSVLEHALLGLLVLFLLKCEDGEVELIDKKRDAELDVRSPSSGWSSL